MPLQSGRIHGNDHIIDLNIELGGIFIGIDLLELCTLIPFHQTVNREAADKEDDCQKQ